MTVIKAVLVDNETRLGRTPVHVGQKVGVPRNESGPAPSDPPAGSIPDASCQR
jgi:hypothetical protein